MAGCASAAPARAGRGQPLAHGAQATGPASGLQVASVRSRGVLVYDVAFAGAAVIAVELATEFELVVRAPGAKVRRIALGVADYDVGDLAVSGDGARAWVASLDGRVRGYELATGEVIAAWQLGAPATAVAVVGDYVATGDATGVVCVRRARDGALLQCAALHDAAVGGLAARGDGGALASVAHDGDAIVWEVPSLRVLARRRAAGSANAAAFAPDGARLAIGYSAGPPIRTPAVVERERARGYGVPDPGARVEVWTLASGEVVRCAGHGGPVTGVEWTPDGARVASSSWDRTVRLWDATTGTQLARLAAFPHLVRALAASPDGRALAIAGWAPRLDAPALTLVWLLY